MARQINVTDSLVLNPTGYTNLTNLTQYNNSAISNSYSDTSSTTYTQYTTSTSAGYVYYTFTLGDTIPNGSTITSVTAQVKVRINNTSRVSNTSCQLYSNTTAKGNSATFSNTSTSNIVSLNNTGSWTLSELNNLRLRIGGTRASNNQNGYIYFYGANVTINYSFQGMAYTIVASSNVSGITVSPVSQELLAGEDTEIRIDAVSLDEIVVTDNDIDVTEQLVRHTVTPGTQSNTFIPSSFDTTNSVYDTSGGDSGNGIYSTNYIENALTDHNSSTRAALYSVQGSGSISKMYYNFDCSSIPANATINSVSCQFKGGTQGSNYYSSYVAYLCSGTTTKTSSVSVTGTNTSPTTVTISGGTWTRADLNNIKILFQVTRGSSNTTTGSTWSFYGATLTVNYTVPAENPYYWTYTLSDLDADHVILIDEEGVFIPPEEDPEYTYYPLTISSINATTNPANGTTRVVAGSNQTIIITPTDPQLTLALDNGVDITNQLVGGVPTNTYTITTQVSGASYGFSLNSGTGYYVSTNNGVAKSASVARINMDFESSCVVTIQYINYAEASYDYGMFGKLDTAVATDGLTASSGTSAPSDSTSNYELAMASNSANAQTITYNVPSGQHFIDVKYGKDDATNSNNDTLQWKVLSIEATSGSADYTYTLTNVQQGHSLVFVFGNVSYYFVTSSGTDCRLFPEGQSVKLAGQSYSIKIVPDDINARVVLTDNNVEQVLVKEEGVDKNNNPAVSYTYVISAVNAAHTLVVTCVANETLYVKLSGTWVEVEKLYKKVNGAWVEEEITYLSDNHIGYLKQG